MSNTDGRWLIEYFTFDTILRIWDWVGAGKGDFIAIKNLHDYPFGIVILVLFICGHRNSQGDRNNQFLFWFKGSFHDFRGKNSIFVEDKLEEGITVAAIVEIDELLSWHLQRIMFKFKL